MGGREGKNRGGGRRSAARCSRSAERTKGPARPAAAPSPAQRHGSGGRRLLPESPPREGGGEERTAALRSRRRDPTAGGQDVNEAERSAPPREPADPQHRTHRPPRGPSALRTAGALRMRHHPPGLAPVARGAGLSLLPPWLRRRMRAAACRLGGRAGSQARAPEGRCGTVWDGVLFLGFTLRKDKTHEFCLKLTLLSSGLSPVRYSYNCEVSAVQPWGAPSSSSPLQNGAAWSHSAVCYRKGCLFSCGGLFYSSQTHGNWQMIISFTFLQRNTSGSEGGKVFIITLSYWGLNLALKSTLCTRS